MAEEARVKFILEWVHEHPEIADRVAQKLTKLQNFYYRVTRNIRNMTKTAEENMVAQRIAAQWYDKERAKLIKLSPTQKIATELIAKARVQMEGKRNQIMSLAEKIRTLQEQYTKASAVIKESTLTDREKAAALNSLRNMYIEQQNRLFGIVTGENLARRAIEKGKEELAEHPPLLTRVSRGLMRAGKHFRGLGLRVGWFAFRTVIMGRMMLRWVMDPLKRGTRILLNWERALRDVASTLGLVAAAGFRTGKRADFLKGLMRDLVRAGIEFKAAWGLLTASLMRVAVDILPLLVPGMLDVADAIREMWATTKDELIAVLLELGRTVLPTVIELIKEVGPAFIVGFVQGAKIAVPLILNLIKALKPIIPLIGKIIGFLVPFAPVLIAVGSAAYLLGPIFTMVGAALQLAALGAGGATISFGGLLAALAPLAPIILAIIAVVGVVILVITHWKEIVDALTGAWNTLMNWLKPAMPLFKAIGNLLQQVGRVIYELVRLHLAILWVALQKIWEIIGPYLLPVLEKLWQMFEFIGKIIWTILKPAIDWLTGALDTLAKMVGGVADFLESLTDTLLGMCFTHAAADAEILLGNLKGLQKEVRNTEDELDSLTRSLLDVESPTIGIGVKGGGRGMAGGAAGEIRQEVTVSATINIESISSEIDLDELTDAVSRGIGEALRRRIP